MVGKLSSRTSTNSSPLQSKWVELNTCFCCLNTEPGVNAGRSEPMNPSGCRHPHEPGQADKRGGRKELWEPSLAEGGCLLRQALLGVFLRCLGIRPSSSTHLKERNFTIEAVSCFLGRVNLEAFEDGPALKAALGMFILTPESHT